MPTRAALDLRATLVLYLDTLEAAGRNAQTVRRYRSLLEPFLRRLDGRPPSSLDVRDYLDTFRSSNTHCLALVTLRQWFRFMQRRELVASDATAGIPIPRLKRRSYAPLSREDFAHLRDLLACDELRVLVTVLFFVGSRIRETLALQCDDAAFDGEFGTIEFRQRKGGQAGFAAFGPEVTAVLRPWLAGRAGKGFNLTYDQVRYALSTSGRLAGIPGALTPHRLRHSFITWAVDAGWNQLVLQQQLGHRNAASTAWYYRPTRAGLLAAYRRSSRQEG